MIFVTLLLLAAAETPPANMPAIALDCGRDSTGNCLPVGPSPSVTLHRDEHDQAAAIYRPYWVCYWEALKTHEEFGTSDAQRATQIFAFAMNTCASQRASADSNMDALLRPLAIYGDEQHKRFVRDYFRSSAGEAFLAQTALAAGQHDAYAKTLEAYKQFVLGQIKNARGQ